MDNKLLVEAISALDNVGFDIKAVAEQNEITFFGVTHNPKTIVNKARETAPKQEIGKGYKHIESDAGISRRPGETWDIAGVMDTDDWREALKSLQMMIRNGCYTLFNIGDFLYVSFEVPAAEHQGVKFGKLKIENAKVQIVEILPDRVIFNFDEILFESAINAADTNDGGFMDSALSRYLNSEFNDAMGIADLLITNHDGMNYSLLTATELFGKSEYWDNKTNWNGGEQIPYFENEKNRVKVLDNETSWHWTSSPRASSAAYFCYVNYSGSSYTSSASSAGGVAPAFCVA